MSDALAFDDPCLVFALKREAGPFLRLFPPQERVPGAPCRARFCGPSWLSVLVLEAGIGPERAGRAIDWALGGPVLEQVPYRPQLVLSAGFCGGLREGLAVGDVVLATEVLEEDGRAWPCTWPGELPPGPWQPPLHRGRVVSVGHLVATAPKKAALAARHDALAVDMESAVLARACAARGVPFGCVRAVSDDSHAPLTAELAQVVGSGLRPGRLLTAVTRSPGLVRDFWTLARHTRRAAGQLALALGELLTLTLPGND